VHHIFFWKSYCLHCVLFFVFILFIYIPISPCLQNNRLIVKKKKPILWLHYICLNASSWDLRIITSSSNHVVNYERFYISEMFQMHLKEIEDIKILFKYFWFDSDWQRFESIKCLSALLIQAWGPIEINWYIHVSQIKFLIYFRFQQLTIGIIFTTYNI
jgi:hypothetical protein